ncbi:MAG: MoaD/ThiS family protein [Deltaproteobacteria bacterium]|nr:MoaD/ThiS family protein [Deltaproteobacteria bacterium]
MITIRFFAMLKNNVGKDEANISIPRQITLNELKDILKIEFPSIKTFIDKNIMFSVNQEFAVSDTIIKDGDEVGLLPPFSGG